MTAQDAVGRLFRPALTNGDLELAAAACRVSIEFLYLKLEEGDYSEAQMPAALKRIRAVEELERKLRTMVDLTD